MLEEHFVSNITPDDHFLDVLNWYRNLYRTERQDTEHGIMVNAINDLFISLKDRTAENIFHSMTEE